MPLEKVFGVVNAAGVQIREKTPLPPIEGSALGVAAHFGAYRRGMVHTAAVPRYNQCDDEGAFLKKMGRRMDAADSLAPDAGYDYFRYGNGAGKLYAVRLTDGTEKVASTIVYGRLNGMRGEERVPILRISAKNGGRWGARRRIVNKLLPGTVGAQCDDAVATIATGQSMLANEFEGATITLAKPSPAVSVEWTVASNTTAGILTLMAGDTPEADWVAAGGALGDTPRYELGFDNLALETGADEGITVRVKDAAIDPANNFGLEIGVDGQLVFSLDTVSMDPASKYYVETVLASTDANDEIAIEDLIASGTAIVPNHRPANWYGVPKSIGATGLSAVLWPGWVQSISDSNIIVADIQHNGTVVPYPHKLTFTWNNALTKFVVTASEIDTDLVAGTSAIHSLVGSLHTTPEVVVTLADQYYTWSPAADVPSVKVVVGRKGAIVDGSTFVVIVSPLVDEMVGGHIVEDPTTNPFTKKRISAITASSSTVSIVSGSLATLGSASTPASVTGTGYTGNVNGKSLKVTVDEFVEKTILFAGVDPIAIGTVVTAINVAVGYTLASEASGQLKLTSPYQRGGTTGKIDIGSIGGGSTANTDLGFVADPPVVTGTAGKDFELRFAEQLWGGHDGGTVTDAKFAEAFDLDDCPLNLLHGKLQGVIGVALPGITATVPSQAAINWVTSKNHYFWLQIDASKTTAQGVIDQINTTIGRSDHMGAIWPGMVDVRDPDKDGVLKRVSVLGMAQGWLARVAGLNGHYGQPAAGTEIVLDSVVATPLQSATQDKPPDEELLNPQGIVVVKRRNSSFVIWGGRSTYVNATWKYYTHRLQLSHYEHTFADQYDTILFALNTPALWASLKLQMLQYFMEEYGKGAIVGEDVFDAARIKIDAGNNTPSTIAAGQLHAEVLLKLANFVEQFVITFGKVGIFESVAA